MDIRCVFCAGGAWILWLAVDLLNVVPFFVTRSPSAVTYRSAFLLMASSIIRWLGGWTVRGDLRSGSEKESRRKSNFEGTSKKNKPSLAVRRSVAESFIAEGNVKSWAVESAGVFQCGWSKETQAHAEKENSSSFWRSLTCSRGKWWEITLGSAVELGICRLHHSDRSHGKTQAG